MLVSKEKLSGYIINLSKQYLSNPTKQTEIIKNLNDKFELPSSLSFDVLTLKTNPIDETEFVLFCILSELDNKLVSKCFTEKEIETYSQSKYKLDKIKFPIKWKLLQVADDQWIGVISVKELMKLRNAQLINYNENAQRRLRHVVAGREEWYTIDLNRDAVNGIAEAYRNDTYIPNTITLNIPETSEFHYDYDNQTLVINEIKAFDILDGYHRYIAMSQIFNSNRKFDYSMELRVVTFSDEKARQFIWQEDQKTKMNKIDSDALNQNNAGNQVVQMLAAKPLLRETIRRNGGNIDATSMSQLVNLLFFPRKQKIDRKMIIEVRDKLLECFDEIVNQDNKVLDKKWNNKYIAAVMFAFSRDCIDIEKINEFYKEVSKDDYQYIFTGRTFTYQTISRLAKVWEER